MKRTREYMEEDINEENLMELFCLTKKHRHRYARTTNNNSSNNKAKSKRKEEKKKTATSECAQQNKLYVARKRAHQFGSLIFSK